MVSVVIGLLVSRSLDDEIEVDLPVVAKTVVGIALDFPSARIAGRLCVTAADTNIDVFECHIPQPVVFGQFVQVFHVRRCLMI